MKPKIFFLMNSLDVNRGGLTKASLKQASFFAEMGYETHMLTFNFNPRNPIIRKKLVDMNRVHKDVIIHNMYEDLEGYNESVANQIPPKKASLTELAGGLTIDKRDGHNAYRLFNNGIYRKYISLHNNTDTLHFIDYFDENRYRTKREVFDLWGNLKCAIFMDLPLNKPRQIIHYNNQGNAFITQWNNPKNEKVQRIILFNDDSTIRNTFVNDDVSHKVNWLTAVINNANSEQSVVVSDTRSTDEVLIKFNHPKAAKVWRLHSGHVGNPYNTDSKIAGPVKSGIDNIDDFDAAIFLTEQQKRDIITRFGEKSNLYVVPHFHETEKTPLLGKVKNVLNTTQKNNKLGVVVSRLSTLKRIDHIIKAFEIVVNTISEAHLEIYGIGDQMESLEQLIKDLDLEDNVFLRGYAKFPDDIYQKGVFSVLASKQEGFALSVLESMYNNTPVISYDIRYGPNDMIVDDKNGYIVENGNIEELAEKMIYLFNNPETAVKMGKEAHKHIEKHFSKKVYKEKWLDVVNQAIKNKFY